MMNASNIIKRSILFLATFMMATTGCSGDPSISVLPSSDSFTQDGNEITAKMDILWVVDNSGSMAPYQADLKANLESFITEFVGKDYDFRMAVTTTDGFETINTSYADINFQKNSEGCVRTVTISSKFLDGNYIGGATGFPLISSDDDNIDFTLTPLVNDSDESDDIETIFGKNLEQGDCGNGVEGGLESIKAALDNPDNASYGFPRADAHLAIIILTDENDFKTVSEVNDVPVADYDTYLKAKASQELGYSFHTIGVLPGQLGNLRPDSASAERYECLVDGVYNNFNLYSSASEGARYAELSDLSGGVKASLCLPFAASLQNIARTIIETTVEFKLTDEPKTTDGVGFIVSIKNVGETAFTTLAKDPENGWSYNAERNSIIFHGTGIPAQNAQINIFYDPDGL